MKRVYRIAFLPLLSVCCTLVPDSQAQIPYSSQIRPGFLSGSGEVGAEGNLDLLIPIWGNERNLLFFNPNLRVDDSDGNEQNIGLGFRRMTDNKQFILGGNIFFDTMRSEYDQRYDQWGAGIEVLSHWADLRANYYLPVGDTDNIVGGTGLSDRYYFSGNSLLVTGGSLTTEEALQGFDSEVSVLIPGISAVMETRLAATYYNFDADQGSDFDGWRGRLDIRPIKAVNLTFEYRDDDVRGSDTFIGGYLEVPLSLENLFSGKNPFVGSSDDWRFGKGVRPLNERMTDKVIRDRHIVTSTAHTQRPDQTVVDNTMLFVNQDNPNQGTGTYENPYQTFAQAIADPRYQPGAWVYVFSATNPYANTGITLLDNMVFWGQGYMHPVYGLGGGNNPVLDGGGASTVVTLANNNEVMGFTIQNGVEGILGSNIKGTNIHDNIIQNNSGIGSGIHIQNNWTPADIDGQRLTFNFANNQILNNIGDGIYLNNWIVGDGKLDNTSIDNTFTDNIVQGNSNYGIRSIIRWQSDGADNRIDNSSFSNTFSGNIIGGNEANQGNGFSGLRSNIEFYSSGDNSSVSNTTFTSRYTANTVVNNLGYGINDDYLYLITVGSNSSLTNVRMNRYIEDNEIRSNIYDGYSQISTALRTAGANSSITNSSINNQINRNVIANNGSHAIEFWEAQIFTQGTDSPITSSTITNAFNQNQLNVTTGYNGININTISIQTRAADSGLANVSIDNLFVANTFEGTNSGFDGISIDNTVNIQSSDVNSPISNGRITNTFTGNTVRNFLRDGFYFPQNYIRTGVFGNSANSPISGSTINNILTNNTVTDNGLDGIYNWRNQIGSAAGVSNSSTNNTYTGNIVDRNGRDGIYIDEDFSGGTNTAMHYTFTNNALRDNGRDGLYMYIDPSNGNLIDKTVFLQGNTITGNTGDGVEIYINGTNPAMFKGDFGGGALSSSGGNTFANNGGATQYDINHRGSTNMDIWALSNTWTNNADPESTIIDLDDAPGRGDIITSQNM